MELKELGSIIAKYAPILGSVITPENPIAGLALTAVAHLFASNATDIDDIAAKIKNDPDAAYKLRELEYSHQDVLMADSINDKANARTREETIVRLTGKRDRILDSIAIIVVVGFFALCVLNYFVQLRDDHIVVMLIGQISSGFMLCLSYYFGSSNKQ